MRAARSRTTQGLSDGGSNRREPGASAASQGQGSGAANAQAPLRSQSTPASSTDSAPKPKPARYNSAPTAVASEAANASSQPPPAESTRPAVRRQQGLFWQPRMQYQFGARNLRTIGKARKRASTADVGKVSDNGAMAMAKAKPGAISSPALLASFRPRTESASHAVGHSGSSSLSLGNPNQAANHNATKADDLTSDSVEEDADSGPSLFENSDSATAMRTVGATASASSSSSSSSNNNNEGASGNVAQWPHHQRAAKHRSLSEPYFNSRKVPPRGAGVGPYGGGRNGRTRGPRPRSRTVRATSESSADSSLTSGTGGGGGAAKSYSRYRALSFLEDINEPDAQGFTVLLRAVQVRPPSPFRLATACFLHCSALRRFLYFVHCSSLIVYLARQKTWSACSSAWTRVQTSTARMPMVLLHCCWSVCLMHRTLCWRASPMFCACISTSLLTFI